MLFLMLSLPALIPQLDAAVRTLRLDVAEMEYLRREIVRFRQEATTRCVNDEVWTTRWVNEEKWTPGSRFQVEEPCPCTEWFVVPPSQLARG